MQTSDERVCTYVPLIVYSLPLCRARCRRALLREDQLRIKTTMQKLHTPASTGKERARTQAHVKRCKVTMHKLRSMPHKIRCRVHAFAASVYVLL